MQPKVVKSRGSVRAGKFGGQSFDEFKYIYIYIYIYIRTDIFALMIQIVFATGSRVAEMLPSREQSRGPGCFCTLCLHVHSAVAVASHATSADFTPPRPPAETHNNKCVTSV